MSVVRRSARTAQAALIVGGLLALLGLLTACGISLDSGAQETEIFQSLSVDGDFTAGGRLQLALDYEQPYPVTVDVACEMRYAHVKGTPTPKPTPGPTPPVRIDEPAPTSVAKLYDILAATLPINPEGGPVDDPVTPVTGRLEREFDAPGQPGEYVVRCYTPRDTNNAIAKVIHISE